MESPRQTEALLAKAQRGDRAAFDLLIRTQDNEVEKYVRLRLGAHLREYVEVEDVLQETYTRAFQALRTFEWRGQGSFLRWLCRLAENMILESARRQRRDQVLLLERDPVASDPSPSKNLRREERFDRFQEALQDLPPVYREVVVLSRIEGLRIKEISRRMNRSPEAVTHLLSRAMKKLKKTFGDTESFCLPSRQLDERETYDG